MLHTLWGAEITILDKLAIIVRKLIQRILCIEKREHLLFELNWHLVDFNSIKIILEKRDEHIWSINNTCTLSINLWRLLLEV